MIKDLCFPTLPCPAQEGVDQGSVIISFADPSRDIALMNHDRGDSTIPLTSLGSNHPIAVTSSTMYLMDVRGVASMMAAHPAVNRQLQRTVRRYPVTYPGDVAKQCSSPSIYDFLYTCVEDPFWHWWTCCGSCPATLHLEFPAGYARGRPEVGSDLQWGWSRSLTHTTAPGLYTCCRFGASRPRRASPATRPARSYTNSS